MRVFVDFENAMLTNSLAFETIFAAIRNYGFSARAYYSKIALKSLPYNPKTISILKEHYSNYNDEINIVYRPEYKQYAEMAKENLISELPNLKLIEIVNKNKLESILNIAKDFDYIGGSIFDWEIYRVAHASSMVSNIFSNSIHYIISRKSKDSRTTWFNGVISTFFGHFHIVLPIFSIWPAWVEVNHTILNLNKVIATFTASFGFLGFASLMRTLLNLDNERALFQKDTEPLIDRDFVIGLRKLSTGSAIMGLYFAIGICGIVKHPVGALVSIVLSVVYFCLMFSPFKRKWVTFVLICFVMNLAIHVDFAKKFFKIIS
jgi:hypothetical protein